MVVGEMQNDFSLLNFYVDDQHHNISSIILWLLTGGIIALADENIQHIFRGIGAIYSNIGGEKRRNDIRDNLSKQWFRVYKTATGGFISMY